jgi:predicted kinase
VKNRLTVVRGISGSGKSYYVKEFCRRNNLNISVHVCSADDYFKVNGVYVFDPTKLPQAHASCMSKVIDLLMEDKLSPVFVDNTHIKRWEYQNYEQLALNCDYEVEIVEFHAETIIDVGICAARNAHQVPQEIVWKMAMEFEPDPEATVYRIFR